MKEFKYYTTKEKWLVIFEYFLSILLPILILGGYIFYNNNNVNYKNMVDYKIEMNNLEINSIAKDESLEASVKVTNNNPEVPFVIRYKFDVDKELLSGNEVKDILKPVNSDRKIIRSGEYYYLDYKRTTTNVLFDEIKWLVDRTTAKDMKFDIKVEAIPATRVSITNKWIKKGDLSVGQARSLNYLK